VKYRKQAFCFTLFTHSQPFNEMFILILTSSYITASNEYLTNRQIILDMWNQHPFCYVG